MVCGVKLIRVWFSMVLSFDLVLYYYIWFCFDQIVAVRVSVAYGFVDEIVGVVLFVGQSAGCGDRSGWRMVVDCAVGVDDGYLMRSEIDECWGHGYPFGFD